MGQFEGLRITARGYAVMFSVAGVIGFFAEEIGLIGWWM